MSTDSKNISSGLETSAQRLALNWSRQNTEIHPTAVIASSAKIGSGTVVGPYSVIGPFVSIGTENTIGSHVVIDGYTNIGNKNLIYQFASVGAAPQDKKFHGERSTLKIGDNNVIREYVTLQPGTEGGGLCTEIGSGNLFMASTHVGHDCLVGNDNVFANAATLAGHVKVGHKVTVGGLSGIHQFVRVGDLALIGAGSMVTQDIPPYCISQGDRARLVGINTIGLQRAGFSESQIALCKKLYRELFMSKKVLVEALKHARSELATDAQVKMFLDFVESSERGVASLRRGSDE